MQTMGLVSNGRLVFDATAWSSDDTTGPMKRRVHTQQNTDGENSHLPNNETTGPSRRRMHQQAKKKSQELTYDERIDLLVTLLERPIILPRRDDSPRVRGVMRK